MNQPLLINDRLKRYAYCDTAEVYSGLGTTSKGLDHEQVEAMREQYGSNNIRGRKSDTVWYRLRRAFLNPFITILFILGVVSFVTDVLMVSNYSRNATTVIIIGVMILFSGAIRFVQELRSKSTADRLERMVHTKVRVRRGGVIVELPAERLAVGDTVLLSAGDRVPADLRVTKAADLFVSQAAVTGESAIVEKQSEKHGYGEQLFFSQYQNLAFMGTAIISGSGEGIVAAVGKDTLYGNFSSADITASDSFHKGANSIAWVMVRFMAVLVPIVLVVSGITKGDWLTSFIFALSVAVGLTPEMLPMVIATCLARGSVTMSKKQVVVKDVSAMQGFGSMDVLCLDKTGTLTNEDILLEYYMDILGNESSAVLDIAYLNSNFHSGVKNPIDAAILRCRTMPERERHFDQLLEDFCKLDERPFDYGRKLASVLLSHGKNQSMLVVKGDVEAVVSRCSFVEYQGEVCPIDGDDFSSAAAVVDEMRADGMKVIAVARKELDGQEALVGENETNFILMGYLAFFDAPKKSAAGAIEKLRTLRVKTKILTGDNPKTTLSVCRRVGIDANGMLTGAALNDLSETQLVQTVEKVDVFVELTPAQKVRVLAALKANGHTVGFLGDGMNDIPAISEADVGISVDTAVDAAKDVADVVLLQKDLNVLENGILEGRKTFANMLKYIKITASSNFGNIFSIVCASAFLPFFPMTAIQLLLLNLLYDILCIVLPWDDVDEDELAAPKEWSGRTLGEFMLVFGPISSVFDIVTFAFLYFILCPALCGGVLFTQLTDSALRLQYIALFQTGWFLESMWTQVLILHMLRSRKTPFLQSRASTPVLAVTLIGIALYTVFTMTPVAGFLSLTALPAGYFLYLLAIVLCYMGSVTIVKRRYLHRNHELL